MFWNGLELPAAYYQDDAVYIIHGDCREVLPLIPDKSIDLTWTDPPYNVGKDYGTADDNLPDSIYLKAVSRWLEDIKRISDKGIVVYSPTKYFQEYQVMIGKTHQIILTWTPEGAVRNGYVNQYASLLATAVPIGRVKDHWHGLQMRGMGYFFKENDYGHPGYTSEAITLKVLTSFSSPDDSILDPFLGSGTTAYCAKKLNRKCIGIEIEQKYCEIAAKRCSQSVMKLEM